MRLDKLTTTFQEALADAQSLAVTRDNPYIEPAHLLAAMLAPARRPEGAARPRRRQRRPRCRPRSRPMIAKLPQVQGGEQVQPGRELARCCRRPRRRPTQARRPVHRQRDVPARRSPTRRPIGPLAASEHGLTRKALEAAIDAVRGGQKVDSAEAEGQREALKKYTLDLTERARARQARPGDRPRRRDPPRDPGAAAAHQEQPGADRRAGRRQDRDRRRPGAAHRRRRGARFAEEQARARARHGAAARRREVPRRVRGAAEVAC